MKPLVSFGQGNGKYSWSNGWFWVIKHLHMVHTGSFWIIDHDLFWVVLSHRQPGLGILDSDQSFCYFFCEITYLLPYTYWRAIFLSYKVHFWVILSEHVLGNPDSDPSSCQSCCHLAAAEIQSVMRSDFSHIIKEILSFLGGEKLDWGNAEDSVIRFSRELHVQLLPGVGSKSHWLHCSTPTRAGKDGMCNVWQCHTLHISHYTVTFIQC